MKKFILTLIIPLAFLIQVANAQNAPVATVGNVVSYGTTAVVPMAVTGFSNINGCDLKLTYDPSIGTATSVVLGPGVNKTLYTPDVSIPGEISIAWMYFNGQTLPDNSVFVNIYFDKVANGYSTIEFDLSDPANCDWYDLSNVLNDIPESDYYIDGSVTFASGSTQWTGSIDDDWSDDSNWTSNAPGDTTIAIIDDVSPNLFPSANTNAKCLGLDIGSGASLTIPVGSSLTVYGNFNNEGQFTIESSATGDGSFINYGAISGGGSFKVERYLTSNAWHLVSSPVMNATSNTFFGIYLYSWSEADSSFTNIISTTEPLVPTHGYYAFVDGSPSDVQFEGKLNYGDMPVDWMTYTPLGFSKQDGWNLAGNPYPSGLKWDSTWSQANLTSTVYVFDAEVSGNWINYNYSTGLGDLPNGEIPPAQGFFVLATAASPSMTIPNSARVHTSNQFYKNGEIEDVFSVKITGSSNSYYDQVTFGINSDATDGFDNNFDAYDLKGLADAPQLYSYDTDVKYSVDLFPELSGNKNIPLGVDIGIAGEYTLSFENLDNFDNSINVYLEDNIGGTIIDIRQNPDYTFFVEEGVDESRFVLHFATGLSAIESDVKVNDVSIYSFGNKVYIDYQSDKGGKMTIYDITGRMVATQSVVQGLNEIFPKVGKGYYIVKLLTSNELITKKVFITE